MNYELLRERFPGRVFVLLDRAAANQGGRDMPMIDKHKFIIPNDMTVGQFMFIVRKRLSLPPEKAMFLFVKNTLPTTGQMMSEVHRAHADPDGFLRMVYTGEAVFGFQRSLT